MLSHKELEDIAAPWGFVFSQVRHFYDTSRSETDKRFHYVLDDAYVLKLTTGSAVTEERLAGAARLVERYCAIGVYAPRILPLPTGEYSVLRELEGEFYCCYVEEFAKYPICGWEQPFAQKEVIAHLGLLAARYTNVDLWPTNSMWSVIDLAPLDEEADEKQGNAKALEKALKEAGEKELAQEVAKVNAALRETIAREYKKLPRCVFQGDLNPTNLLVEDGHFRGLIDFNLAGTEVNINCFLCETNSFPETEELECMNAAALLKRMTDRQDSLLEEIFRNYTLNPLEKKLLPYYRRLVMLFQYPNVCALTQWLGEEIHQKQAVALIRAMVERPLEKEK